MDSAKFIKLYVNGVKAFKDLKGPGTKVFELLYLEMQRNICDGSRIHVLLSG